MPPAFEWSPNVIELVQRNLTQFGRIGATKILTFPDVSAFGGGGVVATSQPVSIRIREPGVVIGLYAQEVAGTAPKFASTRLRLQIGGSEDLFTDGQAGTFVSLLALVGGAQNWWPLMRAAEPGVDWQVTYQNMNTGASCTPSAMLAFIAFADIQRFMKKG